MDKYTSKLLYYSLLCLSLFIKTDSLKHSVIYVHLGDNLPIYLFDSIKQTKLFNNNVKIYVVSYKKYINLINDSLKALKNINCIASEDLFVNKTHKNFLLKTKFSGLWKFAIERFFYIEQVMIKFNLNNVFHLENDNLIYFSLEDYLPIFENNYKGIAAIFDNDYRCIPGFMYIKNSESISKMNDFFLFSVSSGNFDMETIGNFRNKFPNYIDNLPIVPSNYKNFYELKSSLQNTSTSNPSRYSNHINLFNSIFDAASIGQYLGGLNPFHENSEPGFINERSLFNPSNFVYEWQLDKQGRKIPYIKFNNKYYKINNLHVHSKNLKKFMS